MSDIEQDVDVIVVGAGVTGLSSAVRLRAGGASVLVLEARETVGGRLRTTTIDDVRVELGGQWVSADQDQVLGLLDELGIETFSRYRHGSSVYVDRDGDRNTYDGVALPVSSTTAIEIDRLIDVLDQLAASIDPAAPWESPHAAALDQITFDAWIADHTTDREAHDNIAACAGPAMLTKPAYSFSALSAVTLAASVGSFSALADENVVLDFRVSGGLAQIPSRLAEELGDAVVCSAPVARIEWTSEGATVVAGDQTYMARRVIVATPPHVVRAMRFVPSLPPLHLQLRDHQSIGSVIKINAVYATPFWRAAGLSGTAQSPYELVHEAYDNTNDDIGDSHGIIVGFISDVNVDSVVDLSPADRQAAVLASLASYFGPQALDPVGYSESPWLGEEWTGGAYGTTFGVGSLSRFGHLVNEPVGPIRFGSSDVVGPGYLHVDGGIRVGRRMADEVLLDLRDASTGLRP
ncbi:Putrescine oxidase [Aeromicrobium sp. Root236]|uniref:flavin monoamine oxidase family protein n=1 Tax=Aeromicrobium sp. Root236 TaxID=1736498 RepID=UPI0006FBCBD7|nr:FAD-dependent oxidoreductase [Aeromicrobium sp. Root236]KRC65790.1 Putrescine oxidase [Aeromicrobium sp. Root236]